MKNIAVIAGEISTKTTLEITTGIKDCVIANDSNVFFFTCEKHYEDALLHDLGEYNIFRLPDYKKFDGAILINSTIGSSGVLHEIAENIENSGIPAVSMEYYRSKMYNVMIDNKQAMRELVEHFVVDHGFRRINFVKGPDGNFEAEERLAAYREVLFEKGIPYEEKRIYHGNFLTESGKEAVDYFLNNDSELPEAIICSNDVMAFSVMIELEKKGIMVPSQVAVAGFDDENAAKYNEPRLTSVAREQYRTGFASAEKLLAGMHLNDIGYKNVLKTKLKKRESCGCSCRDIIDNTKFRKNHFAQEDINDYYLKEARKMSIELTMVDSITELNKSLDKYIPNLGCDYFLMVLNKEWEGNSSIIKNPYKYDGKLEDDNYIKVGYSRNMELVYGYSPLAPVKELKLDLNGLINWLNERNKGRNFFTILPLHFGDRCFGYCVIGNSEFAFDNSMLSTWLMALSNSLEQIRRQHILKSMIKKLDSMWIYDNLTGLYNRSGFDKYGAYVWQECIDNNLSALILFADLDGLKEVNDNFGHDAGDRFIKAVAAILKRFKKHGEIVMRYGGDEFVLLAPNITEEEAKKYKDKLLFEFETYNMTHSLPYTIDASIGVHVVKPTNISELESAIEEADSRMYDEKRLKRNIR